jgi:hypothetical protein
MIVERAAKLARHLISTPPGLELAASGVTGRIFVSKINRTGDIYSR